MLFDAGTCLPRYLGKVVLLSAPIDIACLSGARNRDFRALFPYLPGHWHRPKKSVLNHAIGVQGYMTCTS
jgi:hypothetical protein